MTDQHETDDTPALASPGPAKPVNRLALASAASAAGLAIGSLTPWVTIFGFGISGVTIHYGLVSLASAAVLGVFAYLTTRTTTTKVLRRTAGAAVLGAVLSLASAVYVGWAIRTSYGDANDSTDEFSQGFADAFRPGLGIGLWLVLLGGALALGCALPTLLQRSLRSRRVLLSLAALAAVGLGGTIAADQKAQSDHRRDVAAAQARAAAEDKAEAAAEAESDRREAEAEQARADAKARAEAAEAADRQRFVLATGACKTEEYGGTTASGTIKNTSSAARTYTVTVLMKNSAGQQVADGTDYVSDVPPGSTAAWEASAFDDAIATCDKAVVEVSEY